MVMSPARFGLENVCPGDVHYRTVHSSEKELCIKKPVITFWSRTPDRYPLTELAD
jgi:hypothetical protein